MERRTMGPRPVRARLGVRLLSVLLLILAGGVLPHLGAPGTAWAAPPASETYTATCVKVADGDTITVLQGGQTRVKIRLHSVDCPELAQPYGSRARELTAGLVAGREVTVEVVTRDKYGRTVARVRVGGKSLQEELLRAGLAWHYKQYDKTPALAKLEQEARAAKRGLWAEPRPTAPWDFRHAKRGSAGAPGTSGGEARRQPAAKQPTAKQPTAKQPTEKQPTEKQPTEKQPTAKQTAPAGALHGNVKSKRYHRPGCRGYDCAHCTAAFATEEEARRAGYTLCGDCARRARR